MTMTFCQLLEKKTVFARIFVGMVFFHGKYVLFLPVTKLANPANMPACRVVIVDTMNVEMVN